MADIPLLCPQCGQTWTISEFVEESARKCRSCGSPLLPIATPQGAAVDEPPRLTLASRPAETSTPSTGQERNSVGVPVIAGERRYAAAYNRPCRRPSSWNELIVFLMIGGLLGGAVWHARTDPGIWQLYSLLRWGVLGFVYFGTCISAFRESAAQGLLCLFFPPFTIWYALSRVESYAFKGLVWATIAMIAVEHMWLPDRSILSIASYETQRFVESVGGTIRRAGEPDWGR